MIDIYCDVCTNFYEHECPDCKAYREQLEEEAFDKASADECI